MARVYISRCLKRWRYLRFGIIWKLIRFDFRPCFRSFICSLYSRGGGEEGVNGFIPVGRDTRSWSWCIWLMDAWHESVCAWCLPTPYVFLSSMFPFLPTDLAENNNAATIETEKIRTGRLRQKLIILVKEANCSELRTSDF